MNMDYCKFENIVPDLHQCLETIQSGDKLSDSESFAKGQLIALCERILEEVKEN